MKKYHVRPDGVVDKCNAEKGQCPFGNSQEHFANKEDAEKYADYKNQLELKKNIMQHIDLELLKIEKDKSTNGLGLLLKENHLNIKAAKNLLYENFVWIKLQDLSGVPEGYLDSDDCMNKFDKSIAHGFLLGAKNDLVTQITDYFDRDYMLNQFKNKGQVKFENDYVKLMIRSKQTKFNQDNYMRLVCLVQDKNENKTYNLEQNYYEDDN